VDRLLHIAKRVLIGAMIVLALVYVGDYAWVRYRMGSSRGGQAFGTVTFYYATPLKNKRVEIFYHQPQTEVCVHSLFPHFGYRPCWYARRDTVRMA
jgi:hypothetical protein